MGSCSGAPERTIGLPCWRLKNNHLAGRGAPTGEDSRLGRAAFWNKLHRGIEHFGPMLRLDEAMFTTKPRRLH